jgi:hypothetical protein
MTSTERTRSANRKYTAAHPERVLLQAAKTRSIRRGTPFNLSEEDVAIPANCPILGIALLKGPGRLWAQSPTLDEIIPGKGYVKGNVQVISSKANTMKLNASPEELLRFAAWVQGFYA